MTPLDHIHVPIMLSLIVLVWILGTMILATFHITKAIKRVEAEIVFRLDDYFIRFMNK